MIVIPIVQAAPPTHSQECSDPVYRQQHLAFCNQTPRGSTVGGGTGSGGILGGLLGRVPIVGGALGGLL